jgi:hypothetical protein
VKVLIGLLVLAAAVGIAIWLLGDHKDKPEPPKPAVGSATTVTVRDHTTEPRPVLPVTVDPATADQAGSATEYTVGGVQIRDHRGGDSPQRDVPPSIHPPNMHQISSTIVNDVAQQVRAAMHQCAADLPQEARGPKPHLDGQLVVSIKNQQLTVTGATLQLRDVFGAGLEPTRQCITQHTIGLHATAANEPDTDSYSISVAFALM